MFLAFLPFVCNDFDFIDLFCDEMVVFELSAPKIASLFVIATAECCPTIDRQRFENKEDTEKIRYEIWQAIEWNLMIFFFR